MEPAFNTSNIEVDLNNIRSMINEIVSSQAGNWYDALAGRDVNALDTDLTDLEDKRVLCRVSELEDVTVGGGNNYAVLTAPGQTPSTNAAIGLNTTLGAVCAELPGAPGVGSTVTVPGQNLIQPKNLLSLVNTATDEPPVDSGGQEIYGLLQIENGATNDAAFDNVNNQGQISFVVVNATRTGFDLTTDAAGLTLQYAYVNRTTLDLIPEECFIPYAGFVDNSASVEVTLTNAYANQGVAFAPLSTTITSQTDSTNQSWDVVNAAGANVASFGVGAADGNVLAIIGDAGAATDSILRVNGTDLDINVSNTATVANGMQFEGAPAIDIGVTDGLIESSGTLTLESNSGNITVQSTTGGNVVLTSAVAITATTPNAADASGNAMTVTLGNSTGGVANGAAATFNTGDGFGAGDGGQFVINLGSGGATGDPGFVNISHAGADTKRVMQLETTGLGGDLIGLFVGTSDPNTRVTGEIGSLFVDGTNAAMWINTDGVTAWSEFGLAGATLLSAAVAAQAGVAFVAGAFDTQWGVTDTQAVRFQDSGASDLLVILGDAGGGTSEVEVSAAVVNFDVDATNNDFLNGIKADTGAAGTTINIGITPNQIDAGGALTVTGADGSAVTLRTANSATGNAGDVNVTGGNGFTGLGDTPGDVNVTGGNAGAASASAGGSIVMTTGAGDGTGSAGSISMTGPNDEDQAIASLTTTGTNGNSAALFVGESAPSAGGGVAADVGSIFFRDSAGAGTTGELWLKTGAADTAWEQFQTGSGDTSLSEAITLETATPFTATNSINWGLADTEFLDLEDSAAATIFRVTGDVAGGASTVFIGTDADFFDVDAANNNFLNGAAFDTGAAGTTINIGVTPNQIDCGGALTVTSGSGGAATFPGRPWVPMYRDMPMISRPGGATRAGHAALSLFRISQSRPGGQHRRFL